MSEACRIQVLCKLCLGISILPVLFKGTGPAFAVALKQIHTIGADVGLFVKLASPDAVHIIILIQKHLAIHSTELFRGIDIEDKDPTGIQDLINSADGLTAVLRVSDIIQTVQCADRQIDAPWQFQLLQLLTNKQGRRFQISCLFPSCCQHVLRHVHTGDTNPLLCQQDGNGAGTAGKVHGGSGVHTLPAQDGVIKFHCGLIIHVIGQPVIAGCELLIRIHDLHLKETSRANARDVNLSF